MSIVEQWFRSRGWDPFPYQRETWDAYRAGRSGLVHAPTGTGKTLAAWLGPVAEWLDGSCAGAEEGVPGIRVLWITPLRALAQDLAGALREPLRDLGLPWTVETRTGDTASQVKARQRKRLPTALITTPESLSLLLSYPETLAALRSLRCVVVDEWHELMSTKRGVQTELGLARLRALAPGVRTWGLSATLGNLDQSMAVLLGTASHTGRLIHDRTPKPVVIETLFPAEIERFPWSGHLGLRLLPEVMLALEGARTTLLFTNTRSQAELWHRALTEALPGGDRDVALHHGSLDAGRRREVEDRLRAGNVRCVVCTSSLDLGVDFSPVDQVVQVGSPKGVARLMQRAGRSGHRPGAASRILGVPAHAFELVEFAAVRDALAEGNVESREPIQAPLDLLAQHVVTVALGEPFREDDLFEEIRTAWSYRNLDREAWGWVLKFVRHGGAALEAYAQFARIAEVDGRYRAVSDRIARMHRMTVGTITSDVAMEVRYANGRKLGTIEETFVTRLRPGEVFWFAGKRLELVRTRDMVATVKPGRSGKGLVPQWQGGKSPLSSRLAAQVRHRLDEARRGRFDGPEMEAVRPLLELQARRSAIPAPDELLVETLRVQRVHLLYLFPFEGRLVHEGLAALLAHRLAARSPLTVIATVNDYGIELRSVRPLDPGDEELRELLAPQELVEDLLRCLNTGELARRQFREVARVAGLVFQGFPGRGRTAKQLQASSGLLFDVFSRYDPDNLLLEQARREVLERQLEVVRMRAALERLARQRLVRKRPERLSPLAFPLWAEHLRAQHVSSEDWSERVRSMALRLERSVDAG